MATKHDELTEKELASFHVNQRVMTQLERLLASSPGRTPETINVLDWGCGRGRSVAKLREKGFNAFGVDINPETMSKGFPLFRRRGLSPGELLKTAAEAGDFADGFFHVIFSEQVFEHIADLPAVIQTQARLTAPGGSGVHCFPCAKKVWEGHLLMPLVHWLPKNPLRKYWIAMMLFLGWGPPKGSWPETRGKVFREQVDVYYHYLNEHTHYRDNHHIRSEFEKYGFDVNFEISKINSRLLRGVPTGLRRNGFPRGSVTFVVRRRGNFHDRTSEGI